MVFLKLFVLEYFFNIVNLISTTVIQTFKKLGNKLNLIAESALFIRMDFCLN